MKCKHVQKQLLDYSESLVDQKARLLIEEHLRNCPECARELWDFEQTVRLLQSLPIQEPPEAFWTELTSRVMRKIQQKNIVPSTERYLFFPNF